MAKRTCVVVDENGPCPNDSKYVIPDAYCPKHYQRWKHWGDPCIISRPGGLPWPRNLMERISVQPDGCHYHGTGIGYSSVVRGDGVEVKAHVAAWELFVGPVPDGKVLDHLCHDPESCPGGLTCPHRSCVRLDHLAPVTNAENVLRGAGPTAINARKTHCHRGHEFTPENTYLNPKGSRECRTCKRMNARRWRRQQRSARKMATGDLSP
jgi:HNH endonuclease